MTEQRIRELRKERNQWREIAYHWQRNAEMWGGAAARVWLLAETVEDKQLARDLREAVVGESLPEISRPKYEEPDNA